MKKQIRRVLALTLSLVMVLTCFAGCGQDEVDSDSLGNVIYGIHVGGSAVSTGFLLDELGYDDKYNFTTERVMTTGPNVYSALAAGTMDIGFLGNGVAWQYFEEDSAVKILTIDNLTNDDRLIVKTGKGLEEYDSIENIYEVLPTLTLALDLTTTPGTFLKSLVNEINKDKADDEKLWYEDVDTAYPLKGSDDKEIVIINTTNSNIPAVMTDDSIDACITFSSQRTALTSQEGLYVTVASTFTHLSDTITPSTWAVNAEWAEENPELCIAFTQALLEAFDYRANEDNQAEAIQLALPVDQLDESAYDFTSAYWPTAEEIAEYYYDESTIGYTYLEQIRDSHIDSNGLTEDNSKTVEEAFASEYLIAALENLGLR